MTCIIGYDDGKRVWVGGDSMMSSGWTCGDTGTPKVFESCGILWGTCGEVNVRNALTHRLALEKQKKKQSTENYIHMTVVDAVKKALGDAGRKTKKEECESFDGQILGVYRGMLFTIEGNFQVTTWAEKYATTGSGWAVALGAMAALNETKGRARVLRALEIVEHHVPTVRGPLTIKSQRKS